jgi:uncharacterized membrane protein
VLTLGCGLVLRRRPLRLGGLALLAVAAIKVFVVDLPSLDMAYRVVSLVVFGLLLVASAYVWSRFRPPPSGDPGITPGVAGGP